MRFIPLAVAGLLLSITGTPALADHLDTKRPVKNSRAMQYGSLSTYLGGGWGFGGDEIGRFADNNGDVEKVRSGGGLLLEGGLLLSLDPGTRVRLTAGYQVDSASRVNGDTSFERIRFDGMLLRGYGPHEFGVGITSHTSVDYSCNISSVCSGDVEFDAAVGYTLEYAVRIGDFSNYRQNRRSGSSGVRLGLRYTGIEYRPRLADSTVEDFKNGNSVLGFVGFNF